MTNASVVHETHRGLALKRAEMGHEIGRWLLAAKRLDVHVALGYGSFGQYAQALFGFSVREARERLRVARSWRRSRRWPRRGGAARSTARPFAS